MNKDWVCPGTEIVGWGEVFALHQEGHPLLLIREFGMIEAYAHFVLLAVMRHWFGEFSTEKELALFWKHFLISWEKRLENYHTKKSFCCFVAVVF